MAVWQYGSRIKRYVILCAFLGKYSSVFGMIGAAGELAEKQHFLREEIIYKNYDGSDFIAYINQTENGCDLNNWTLEELNDVVKKFKKEQTPEEQQSQESSCFCCPC